MVNEQADGRRRLLNDVEIDSSLESRFETLMEKVLARRTELDVLTAINNNSTQRHNLSLMVFNTVSRNTTNETLRNARTALLHFIEGQAASLARPGLFKLTIPAHTRLSEILDAFRLEIMDRG